MQEFARLYDEPAKALSPRVGDLLVRYDWPGNVRELRNALERAFLYCPERMIDVEHLPDEVREAAGRAASFASNAVDAVPSLAEAERMLIARVLKAAGGNQSAAARVLDVERHRLRRLIERHGLSHLLVPPRR
jgi:DNA-binding NtrC family response regulator